MSLHSQSFEPTQCSLTPKEVRLVSGSKCSTYNSPRMDSGKVDAEMYPFMAFLTGRNCKYY